MFGSRLLQPSILSVTRCRRSIQGVQPAVPKYPKDGHTDNAVKQTPAPVSTTGKKKSNNKYKHMLRYLNHYISILIITLKPLLQLLLQSIYL